MKKLMIAAAAMMAGVAMADVESANVVGYNTFTIKQGFNLCAVNFKDVAKGDAGASILELFPTIGTGTSVDGLTYGTGISSADYLMVNKGGTSYDYYFLYANKGTKGSHDKDFKWVDTSLNVISENPKIKNGDAFWFQKYADGDFTLTISGEVEMSASKEIVIKEGFNLLGSYFPAGFNPNGEPYTTTYWQNAGAKGGTGIANADYLMVNKGGTNYDYYFLYLNSGTKGSHDKDYKWVDTSLTPVSQNIVNPGQGFWYQHYGDQMTIEIKRQF